MVVLARLGAPHGVRGQITLHHVGSHLPHFVGKEIRLIKTPHNTLLATEYTLEQTQVLTYFDGSRVAFETIQSRESAAALTHLAIAASRMELQQLVEKERNGVNPTWEDLYYFELLGLQVHDAHSKSVVGVIVGVEEVGLNTLVYIQREKTKPVFAVPWAYPHWQRLDLRSNIVELDGWRGLSEEM